MHPSLIQVPPSSRISIRATFAPRRAAIWAAGSPPCPPPITARSNLSIFLLTQGFLLFPDAVVFAVRAEHTAIARQWPQHGAAAGARVKGQSVIPWDVLFIDKATFRAGQIGAGDNFARHQVYLFSLPTFTNHFSPSSKPCSGVRRIGSISLEANQARAESSEVKKCE